MSTEQGSTAAENANSQGASSNETWDDNSEEVQRGKPTMMDLTMVPLSTGFIQGFVAVAMKYRREKRAARKAALEQEALEAAAAALPEAED